MSELALQLIAENKKTKNSFLDLGNCGLKNYLPDELLDCVWLERLNLSSFYYDVSKKQWEETSNKQSTNRFIGNGLIMLEKLTNLNSLDLSNNEIRDIRGLEKLTNLNSLNLISNQIKDIRGLEKLTNLTSLDLSQNQITDIRFLEKLTNLTSLDLSQNQITDIRFLEKLTNLTSLDLSQNQITDIRFLEKLTNLISLNLSYNKITDIRFLEKLTNLTSLNLCYNKIKDYLFLEKLASLNSLDVRYNQIRDIRFLEKLINLKSLDLSDNQIRDIRFLEKLTNLNSLELRYNQITDIKFLEKLINLNSLNLCYNKIKDIRFLEKLINLNSLDLSNNQITDIQFLEKLINLKSLDLGDNQIIDVIPILPLFQKGTAISFERYNYSQKINLYNNPIITPPMHIVKQGNESILAWFENRKISELKPFREAKVILLGEPDAGKSNLLNYFLGRDFEEEKSVTRGVKIEKYVFQHQENDYQINFWDFGGQEVQQSVHQYFLTENTLYIIVLNAVTDEQPDKYLQFLNNHAPNSPFIIVTNKDDLQGTSKLKNNQLNADYEGRIIASNLRISLRQAVKKEWCPENTSIFEDRNTQLKELFNLVKSSFLKLPHVEEGFLANYKAVKNVVEDIYKNQKKPYITIQEFTQFCREKGIVMGTEKSLLSLLNIIGTVRFLDEDNLRSLHILNPEWLSDGIYRIITDGDVKNKKLGKIYKREILQILKPKYNSDYTYQAHEIDFLVDMMCSFRVAYFDREEKSIYIPDSFPEDLPNGFNKSSFIAQSKHYFFSYDTEIPSYIISRFIVKSFQYVKENHYWNKGIVLEDKEHSLNPCEALIEQNDRKIDIWIKGRDIQSFFVRIREILRNAHEKTFKNYTEMISLGEESVTYKKVWNLKIDGDTEFKSEDIEDLNTGKLKLYNINEVLGRFETNEIMEKKEGDTIIINGNVKNSQVGRENNRQKNIFKVALGQLNEFKEIKEILLDLQEADVNDKLWKSTLIKCLDEFNRMEDAEDKASQKTSKSIIERGFATLKNIKDVAAIGFLPVDIDQKFPKLLDLVDKILSQF